MSNFIKCSVPLPMDGEEMWYEDSNILVNLDLVVTFRKTVFRTNNEIEYYAISFYGVHGIDWRYSEKEERDKDYDKIINIVNKTSFFDLNDIKEMMLEVLEENTSVIISS